MPSRSSVFGSFAKGKPTAEFCINAQPSSVFGSYAKGKPTAEVRHQLMRMKCPQHKLSLMCISLWKLRIIHEVVDDFCGVDPVLAQWARPLLTRLRGPVENWPSAKDFCDVPLTEPGDDARSLNVCFAQIDDLRESKDDLEAAGSRPLPQRMNALPVEVALFCLSRVTGFPDKLVKQVFETMKAASLRKDLELHIKSSLRVLPRAPSLGIAAPGSKKTPVQQELINRVFCKVLERFPFLAHNNESQGEHLLFDGGSTAGFVKQLKQNQGYVYLVVEELVSFFDPSYAASGNTNTGQHIAPSTLLPLRTGNGISRSLASDLGNRIQKTQAAMSMMGQEDVVRKFFCAKGMSLPQHVG